MVTKFTITCTGWEDPDQPLRYEFGYVNYYQESVLYVSRVSTASSLLLPMGREDNDFKLSLRLRIIDKLGAASVFPIEIPVRKSSAG